MRKLIACAAVLVAALALTVPGAIGGPGQTPGVTAKTITIGGTLPADGPAARTRRSCSVCRRTSSTSTPAGAGRQARDHGAPGHLQDLRRRLQPGEHRPAHASLVEEDKVFAVVGQLGTELARPVRAVPQPAEGAAGARGHRASYWGTQYKEFPWTIGFQPDYIAEGRLYGLHIKANQRGKKIAIIYQNDDYGKDWLYGLRSAREAVRRRQHRRAGGGGVHRDQRRTRSWRGSGAAVRRSSSSSHSDADDPAYATGKALGYNPEQIYVNSVSSTAAYMNTAVASAGAPYVNGSISVGLPQGPVESGLEPRSRAEGVPAHHGEVRADGQCVERALRVRGRVGRDVRAGDVQGREEPDPRGLMNALLSLNTTNRFALPGVVLKTSKTDHWIISQMRLQRYNDGLWTPIAPLVEGVRARASLRVTGRRAGPAGPYCVGSRYCSQ